MVFREGYDWALFSCPVYIFFGVVGLTYRLSVLLEVAQVVGCPEAIGRGGIEADLFC